MRKFNAGVNSGANQAGQTSGKSFSNTFAKAAAVGLAVFGAGKIFGGLISDAQESAKVSRITENAIRATGGAANVTAQQVGDLATSLSNATAVDDELIQSGANLLLTFKNVRNEVGKGNDIFDQATAAAVDLSAAGFGSVESASVQLGKALNDPVAGMSALSRSGITFTEQQKDQIRVLTESGDLLGAQSIILEEIQGQVGGAAAAASDPIEKLKVTMGNLGETVGGFLLPHVERFATFVGTTVIPGVTALFDSFKSGEATGQGFIGFMSEVGVIARDVFGWLQINVPIVWGYVKPVLREFSEFLTNVVGPALRWLWLEVIVPAFDWLRINVPPIWEGYVKPALTAFWDFVQNILAPTLLWLWHNVVAPGFQAIGTIITVAWDVVSVIFGFFKGGIEAVGTAFTTTKDRIGGVWEDLKGLLQAGWTWISVNVFAPIGEGLGTVKGWFTEAVEFIGKAWDGLRALLLTPINFMIGTVDNDGIVAAWNFVADLIGVGRLDEMELLKLAAGGPVTGYSPHKRADNILLRGTAGEFMQPVDTVNYYGPDAMEALRTRTVPREALAGYADGGLIRGYSGGGSVVPTTPYVDNSTPIWEQLWNIISGQFPRAKLNSGYRSGDPGYHGAGKAIDVGEAGFSGGAGRQYIADMARWVYDTYPSSTELIYTGLYDTSPDLKNGQTYNYGSATNAQHTNHMHWAMADYGFFSPGTRGKGAETSLFTALAQEVKGVFATITDPLINLIPESPPFSGFTKDIVTGIRDDALDFLFGKAEAIDSANAAMRYGTGTDTDQTTTGLAGQYAANVSIMQGEAAKFGWSEGAQWQAQYALEMGEAGFNNLAQNPTSTAFGMGQFLDSTWAPYGPKTSDPTLQSRYMFEYIQDIYGDPINAYDKWASRDPHWYDDGGLWPDGTIGGNRSGGPERVLNREQTAAFERLVDNLVDARPAGSLQGLRITGSMQLVGNGLFQIIDGRIEQADERKAVDNRRNRR